MTEAFTIEQPAFDAVTGVATFRYTLGELSFSEVVTFPSGSDPSVAATPSFLKLLQLEERRGGSNAEIGRAHV